MPELDREAIGDFLDWLYMGREGHVLLCVGIGPRMEDGKLKHDDFTPVAFNWPEGKKALVDAIEAKAPTCDIYVTVGTFKRPRRTAENALPTDLLWADDLLGAEGDPRVTLVDSGGGKPDSRQGYIRLAEKIPAEQAAALSAAVFEPYGDPEGFDAARVLRVPGTFSHKTDPPTPVAWLQQSDVVVPLADLPHVQVTPAAESTVEPSGDFDREALPGVPRLLLNEEPNGDRSMQTFDFLKECREEHVPDADALAAVLHHRPTRERAEEKFPRSRDRQDDWIVADAQRILAKLDEDAEPAVEASAIEIVSVADFTAMKEEGAEPLLGVKGNIVLPAGVSMLYGLPGSNKTALADDLAFHLASGEGDWLGIPIPKRRRVLSIENEGPRSLRRERLDERLKGCLLRKPEGYLKVWQSPWAALRLPNEHWREALAEQIATLEVDLVTIGPIRSLGMEGHGTLQEVEEFVGYFLDVGARSGRDVGWLVIHHENRAGSVSGVWEGAVESLFHAQGRGHGKVRLHFQKCRWSSEYHATGKDLVWSSSTPYSFEVKEKTGAQYLPEEVEEMLLTAVENMPGTAWRPVEDSLPGTKQQRKEARDSLLASGHIVNLVTRDGEQVVLHAVEQGKQCSLYLADHPAVLEASS